MADISCNLPLPLLKRLEEEKRFDPYIPKSTTTIIHEALVMYFLRKDLERGGSRMELSTLHYPMTYKEHEKLADEQIKNDMQNGFGLTIPEVLPKKESDPEIKPAFSISSIEPGPGIVKRLQDIGVSAGAVVKARRAKYRGESYDKDLEKYFDLEI